MIDGVKPIILKSTAPDAELFNASPNSGASPRASEPKLYAKGLYIAPSPAPFATPITTRPLLVIESILKAASPAFGVTPLESRGRSLTSDHFVPPPTILPIPPNAGASPAIVVADLNAILP